LRHINIYIYTYFFSFSVTVPLVAWRNASGRFLNVDDVNSGTLGLSDGEKYHHALIPKSEQLFGFTPHPGDYR